LPVIVAGSQIAQGEFAPHPANEVTTRGCPGARGIGRWRHGR
jgi:hypothetical protein